RVRQRRPTLHESRRSHRSPTKHLPRTKPGTKHHHRRTQARSKRPRWSLRLRATPQHEKSRCFAPLPTAFEVRLKTQWESADTTKPPGDVRYLQVGLSS